MPKGLSLRAIILALLVVIYTLFFSLHQSLFLKADDWCRSGLSQNPIHTLSTYVPFQYVHWTGRVVVTFLEFTVINHVSFWNAVNPVFILALIINITLLFAKGGFFTPKGLLNLLLSLVLVVTLDTKVSLEVYYWLTGSVNYLWPIVVALSFITIWNYSLQKVKQSRFTLLALPILAVTAGNLHEQVGILAITFVVGSILFLKVNGGKSISQFHFLVCGLLIISYLSLIVAPGNYVRLQVISADQNKYSSLSGIDKIALRSSDVLNFFHSLKSVIIAELLLAVALLSDVFIGKKRKTTFTLNCLLLILVLPYALLLLFQLGDQQNWWQLFRPPFYFVQPHFGMSFQELLPYVLFGMYGGAMTWYARAFMKTEKEATFLLLIIAGFLSKAFMVISPGESYRTFFITIVILWSCAVYVISRLDSKFSNSLIALIIFLIGFHAIFGYINLRDHFRNNNQIMQNNEEKINNFQSDKKGNLLFLNKIDDQYNFDMPYVIGASRHWQTVCFKNYFDLDDSSVIVWE